MGEAVVTDPGQPRTSRETVVAHSPWSNAAVWLAAPLAGALIGCLLKLALDWAATLRWVPFKGPLELFDSIPEPHATIGAFAVGALGGLVLTYFGQHESLRLVISDDRVRLTGEGYTQDIERGEISALFREKDGLVVLGNATEEIARRPCFHGNNRLANAFRSHGYPWRNGDPHAGRYRRWVPDDPELSGSAHALFKAREKTLGKIDDKDARELRHELAKLGIVVHDDKKRQYWRTTGDPGPRH